MNSLVFLSFLKLKKSISLFSWTCKYVSISLSISITSNLYECTPTVEGSKYVFESKTIMRMELLVLLSLQWKMNPVTLLAIFDYTMRRLGLITHRLHSEFMNRCARIALAVVNGNLLKTLHKLNHIVMNQRIANSRSLVYLPSVMAAAIMFLVFKVIDPDNSLDFQIHPLINYRNTCSHSTPNIT
uniref:Cyclin C-terminal domain-containing protein n=1 Tax=Lactuca sativa TaxID=4236 RepID=A0A9R1UDQ3_LACSA|nr:hypothetical protein LSAT_V11C900460770 [Lactuca sativa]